jgi:hypothetical protein
VVFELCGLASLQPVQKGHEVIHHGDSPIGREVIAIAIEEVAVALSRTGALGGTQGVGGIIENHIGVAGQQAGQLPAQHRAADLALLARATVYGLARMQLDGHFGQWAVPAEQEAAAMARTLDLLVDLMAANGRAD